MRRSGGTPTRGISRDAGDWNGIERALTAAAQPGALFAWMRADGRYVVNLMTQAAAYGHGEKPGQATTEAVGHALRELQAGEEGEAALDRAAATGVGGLDWKQVKPRVERHLGELDVPVYL
jgi:hypothetical protein